MRKNELASSLSPYLLQHKDNPVHWQEWKQEVFTQASEEHKPVFVSIGYSACHWCHVMAHESFEDKETADLLNAHFICIKVDKEVRPDVDSFLMGYVQHTTGHGGWPLSVFLTPDKKPFFGGTYFPKESQYGLPSFKELLRSILHLYKKGITPDKIPLRTFSLQESSADPAVMCSFLQRSYDPVYGGFGHFTKFPPWGALLFLLRHSLHSKEALAIVSPTLQNMADKGLYDLLGGGFHRYCVDREWSVPHFEKMLYDQAMALWVYSEAYALTKKTRYKEIVEQTILYLQRECLLTTGYAAALDADSKGKEGDYYLWTQKELSMLLKDPTMYFHLPKKGHLEGKCVLHMKKKLPAALHKKLLDARNKRTAQEMDRKVLTCWNSMLGHAFCVAGKYVDGSFIAAAQDLHQRLSAHVQEDSFTHLITVRRYSYEKPAELVGFLEDHAWFGLFSLSLYESTGIDKYLNHAKLMHTTISSLFWADDLSDISSQHELLGERIAELVDHPYPSSASATLYFFSRLGRLTGEYPLKAERLLKRSAFFPMQSPEHYGFLAALFEESTQPMIKGALEMSSYLPTYLRDPACDPLQICIGTSCRKFPSREDIFGELKRLYKTDK